MKILLPCHAFPHYVILASYLIIIPIMRCLVSIAAIVSYVGVDAVRVTRDYDPILAGSLDMPSRDSTGSMSFNPSSQYFSLDVGSNQVPRTLAGTNPVLAAVGQQVDYQMANSEFLAPATSYTSTLDAFTPPVFEVKGCKPSEGRASCKKGKESTYNLAMPNPRAASR